MNLIIEEKDMLNEFKHIQEDIKGYSSGNFWNEIVLNFQWREFYKHELNMWKENKMIKGLPLRSYIYANRMKYIGKGFGELTDREILRAFKISGIHVGNSFHSPFWIKQFIEDYKVKSIYDPCGGWGHRLLGAHNISYIYNDINPVTYSNCIDMANYLNINYKYFYNKDSANFIPIENYEAIFTCPPYHNIEKYSEYGSENLDYSQFLEWWHQTVKHSLNKDSCRYFAFIINHKYQQDMTNICINNGLNPIEKIILGSSKQLSHFNEVARTNKSEILNIFER
jgi:hypothetical protein